VLTEVSRDGCQPDQSDDIPSHAQSMLVGATGLIKRTLVPIGSTKCVPCVHASRAKFDRSQKRGNSQRISLTFPRSHSNRKGFVKVANRRNTTDLVGPTDLLFDLGKVVAGNFSFR
jgi:hypothetical protein